MKAARFADSHATSTREVDYWQDRASCRERPNEWDLDVIGDDVTAIRAAQQACWDCPSLSQCEVSTLGMPKKDRPKELVQAGRVWTESKHLPRRLAKDEASESATDRLRAAHVQYVRLKSCGLDVSAELRRAESAYQRWRKREQRKATTS